MRSAALHHPATGPGRGSTPEPGRQHRVLPRSVLVLLIGLIALSGLGGGAGVLVSPAHAQTPPGLPDGEIRGADLPKDPVLHDGQRWRLGYMEGGQYPDYRMILQVTLNGLADLGWMEPVEIPRDLAEGTRPDSPPDAFWTWLADNAKSDYLEFVKDAYFAPGDFDKSQREAVKEAVHARLTQGDIDLMVAMGTWAGQDLATPDLSVPIVVGSASDPLGSGIVASVEDSGNDFVHAKVEPERYQRQVRIFHDLIGFSSLGVVYDNTPEGRTYGGVDAVEQVAQERGFDIKACNAPFPDLPQDVVDARTIECYAEVAAAAEAVYVTVHRGVNENTLPRILEVITENKRPSFSMLGSSEVRRGVLMSVAQADFSFVGRFHAEVIAKILNGAKPRDLDQRWSAPPKIALNLKEAEMIGFDPPVDILIASDEIYEEIEQ